jgi:hypothetical protein
LAKYSKKCIFPNVFNPSGVVEPFLRSKLCKILYPIFLISTLIYYHGCTPNKIHICDIPNLQDVLTRISIMPS